jgi:decaprenyl-phosphate phosphoribosyltransferase
MTTLRARMVALRPAQWVKNVPVAAPLLFGHRLADPSARLSTFGAFVAFCAVASAGYLVNDVRDRATDRVHPRRAERPVARGDLGPREALATAVVLGGLALTAARGSSRRASPRCSRATSRSLAYSLGLKRPRRSRCSYRRRLRRPRARGRHARAAVAVAPHAVVCWRSRSP